MRIHKAFDHPLASLVRPPAGHPQVAGFRYVVLRATLNPRSTLPPPRRSGLRFPAPVGHGRGLASSPAAPVRGKASIPLVFVSTGSGASFHRDLPGFACAQRSSMPGERASSNASALSPSSTGPATFLADPDHASVIRNSNKVQKQQPPHPKCRAAVAAGERSNLCFPAERPLAGLVKKIIAVAPAALGIRLGSSSSRRQPTRLRSSPIRITPLLFSRPSNCSKQQPPRLKCQSRSLPLRRHQLYCQSHSRRISDNAIYV